MLDQSSNEDILFFHTSGMANTDLSGPYFGEEEEKAGNKPRRLFSALAPHSGLPIPTAFRLVNGAPILGSERASREKNNPHRPSCFTSISRSKNILATENCLRWRLEYRKDSFLQQLLRNLPLSYPAIELQQWL